MIQVDPLAAAASAVTVVSSIGAAAVWVIRRRRARRESANLELPGIRRRQPLDIEVIPLSFEVSLRQQIPEVRVYVRCVNYLRKPMELEKLEISYLRIENSLPLENIQAPEDISLPPRNSLYLACAKRLIDSEIRVLQGLGSDKWVRAEARPVARGRAGRRITRFESMLPFSINGVIQ